MIRTLPKWYGRVEGEIKRTISKQANELNIQWRFVHDSKTIDESLNAIMNVLVRLKEEVRGEFNEEEIENFKKFKEATKKKTKKSKAKKPKSRQQSKK